MPPAGAWTTGACELIVNGRVMRAAGVAPTTTLLEWLRSQGLTGTKRGCDEGDCGACTVALVDRDAQGRPTYRAFNSCIALLPMFAGREIVTVEALAEGAALHPVQDEMVRHYGSQCGYCTPGFTVSLFEAYYKADKMAWNVDDGAKLQRAPASLHRHLGATRWSYLLCPSRSWAPQPVSEPPKEYDGGRRPHVKEPSVREARPVWAVALGRLTVDEESEAFALGEGGIGLRERVPGYGVELLESVAVVAIKASAASMTPLPFESS